MPVNSQGSGIAVVGAGAYLAGIRPVRESGDCVTHLARLRYPAQRPGNFYLKHYLEDRAPASKGLVNEVCGNVLARSAGLATPVAPLILTLPREHLAGMHPAFAARISDPAVLWGTAAVDGPQLPADPDLAGNLLRRWKQLGDLIAFDTWVVPDRSPANLVRHRNGEIVLIDHGHLAGSVRWLAELLPTAEERPHRFLALWQTQRIPDELNQRIMVAAERHKECFSRAERELNHWLGVLPIDSGDRMALLEFLHKRAGDSDDRMKRVLGLIV